MTSRAGRRNGSATVLIFAVTAAIGCASAADAPNIALDPRLKVVEYRSGFVLALTAFVGYHVHFEFAPGEYFVNLGAADTAGLDVGAEGNHMLLKPKLPTSGTNLTILTNKRAYFLAYRALARVPNANEVVYSISFRYPETTQASDAARRPSETIFGGASSPPGNQSYWYCGSASLRPVSVIDDGVRIRLQFAPRTELPAVFAREPDGEETLVNTHVEDGVVVVHRLTQQLVLRRGRLAGSVVNRGTLFADRPTTVGYTDHPQTRTYAP